VSYPTAWLIHHKLMCAMAQREARYVLEGQVHVDDAYLGGERSGGTAGRGSENKVSFVAAVSLTDEGHPLRIKLTPVSGFTLKAIKQWAQSSLAPVYRVFRRAVLLYRRQRGRMHASTHRHWRAKAQGSTRIQVDQHRAG
jgi:hypothetical protein